MTINEILGGLKDSVEQYGIGPKLSEMEGRTLEDKGVAGSTAAHVIEEVHTPNNIAFTTFTTGTSAFQNIVGVTYEELGARIRAGIKTLKLSGLRKGDRLLVTYPPLVNVFPVEALRESGVEVLFMDRPNRDSFLYTLCSEKPEGVLGESAFIRASLEAALDLGLAEAIPHNLKILVAGTPLDLELLETVKKLKGGVVHDLYGCQEFGWLMVDGTSVREDTYLLPTSPQEVHVIVGGLVTGDIFRVGSGHVLGKADSIPTYSRVRSGDYWETIIDRTTATNEATAQRTATSILRIKGRIVRLGNEISCGESENGLMIYRGGKPFGAVPQDKLGMFNDLQAAQLNYQQSQKKIRFGAKRATMKFNQRNAEPNRGPRSRKKMGARHLDRIIPAPLGRCFVRIPRSLAVEKFNQRDAGPNRDPRSRKKMGARHLDRIIPAPWGRCFRRIPRSLAEGKFNRHDLVYVKKSVVERMRQQLVAEDVPETLLSRLEEIPFIIKQQSKAINGELEVGISFPTRTEGVRLRRQGIVPADSIIKKITPYMVAEKFYSRGSIEVVDRLMKAANSYGASFGLFGSLALELVSEVRYTHKDSDIDFIVAGLGENLVDFLSVYKTISSETGAKMDGEVYFPSMGSVKILELLTESSNLLVKGFYESFLLSRKELEGYESTQQRDMPPTF